MQDIGFGVLLLIVLIVLVYLMALPLHNKHKQEQDKAAAQWTVRTVSNTNYSTSVYLSLKTPKGVVLESRGFGTSIADTDPNYDEVFFNRVEDARVRAQLLNASGVS